MSMEEIVHMIETRTRRPAKKSGSSFSLCCPAHDDANPSLSISMTNDEKILMKCHAGCTVESICGSVDIKMSDLFPQKIGAGIQKTVYSYQDEAGQELYRKVRVEPGSNGRTKDLYFERDDGSGRVVRSIKGCRRVLYRLPQLLKSISNSKTIFLVEGEKDTDKLIGYGLSATTASSSLIWEETFTTLLKEADVVILYDTDKTGHARRDLLCKKLYGKVQRLRVIDLPGLVYHESHGSDVSDWLRMGNTVQQLLDLVDKTADYTLHEPQSTPEIQVVTLKEFLDMQLPQREMLLSPILPEQGLVLLYAKRGVGKTHVALGISLAVATGGRFLKWEAPRPRKMLYIDGEMPAVSMQQRLHRIAVTEDRQLPSPDCFRLITPDLQEKPIPDLSTREGQAMIEPIIQDSDLIVIDNLSCLFRSGVENEAESWQPFQDWALKLRRQGKSILFVHHAGKSGGQRGSSKKEDILDVVIALQRPANYSQDQGACFEVVFDKARHFAGEEAVSFTVQLRETDDSLWYWDMVEKPIDPEVQLVAEKLNQGRTIGDIVEETRLTKSQVETRKKKAKELGLINS